MIRIGLISDTHGLLRPEALAFLRGSDHIVHAGDICEPEVLERLAAIAPLTAVKGNNDHGAWADRLGEIANVEIGGFRLQVIHDLARFRPADLIEGAAAVIHGHSHKPSVQTRDGVLYVNPGSAGPRRFTLPISVGEITLRDGVASARTHEIVSPPRG